MNDNLVEVLEDLLAKAKSGELSSVFFIAPRSAVDAGGVAYQGFAGNYDRDRFTYQSAFYLAMQAGQQRWDLPTTLDFGLKKLPTLRRRKADAVE